MSATPLDYVLEEFEGRLKSDGAPYAALTLADALDPGRSKNAVRLHRAVQLGVPASRNTDDYRDQDLARSEDTVTVTLRYRINPSAQHRFRREGIAHAELVRRWLTDPLWIGALRVRWRATARSTGPTATEIYTIVQTYTVTRDAALGGWNG